MKKMIMILAAISAVTMVQASAVKWNGNGSADQFKFTGGVAFTTGAALETSAQTATLAAYFLLAADAGSLTADGGRAQALGLAKAIALGQVVTTATAAGRVQTSSTVAANTPAGTVYFARVFVTVDAKDYFFDSKSWTTTVGSTYQSVEALSWANKGGTQTWTAVVPEPTSMALLALGVAAMGLRRKFRK